jgi:hypothetical protein
MRQGKMPCNGCRSRDYCSASSDTCPQYRHWVVTGCVLVTYSKSPDGIAVDSGRFARDHARAGYML